jgi:mono/diheme cytochrome c family protein
MIRAFLAATLALLIAGCGGKPAFTKPRVLGGETVSAARLNRGREVYEIYCFACHGLKGDGRGPAAIGLRPPARDFTLGLFKFAAVPSGQLPRDADLVRIVRGGLHGTAMLPWKDVPEQGLLDAIQYLKTFSPKWAVRRQGREIVPGPDPWGEARRREAETRGMKVYHGLAQCASCHPAYESKETIDAASRELVGRAAVLREDAYVSKLTDSEYGVKLMPPDFTRDDLRAGTTLPDLYRTIAAGIGGTAMPSWKGSLPEGDLWALAYYVRFLSGLRGTPGAATYRETLAASR